MVELLLGLCGQAGNRRLPIEERGEVDGATLAELAELGDVRWLLAPNEIHNIGLKGFQSAFPEAHTSACMGHPRRVEGVRFDAILKPDDPSSAVPWISSASSRSSWCPGH